MHVSIKNTGGEIGRIDLERGVATPANDLSGRVMTGLDIVEPNTLVHLKPESGDRYMRAFPYNLNGSRVWAELVE